MAAVRVLVVLAWFVGASCATPSDDRAIEAEFATFPYRGLPAWRPLPETSEGRIAHPVPWTDDARPTVFVFTASWCPPCIASLLQDLELARAYGDRFQIGIALEETDADFTSSDMAPLLADVPVWTAPSVRAFATRCGVRTIPAACLVDHGRVVVRTAPLNIRHVLDAYGAATLDAQLAAETSRRATVAARLALGVSTDEVDAIVEATASDPQWQHAIALALASRFDATASDLVFAVALARAAVAAGGGLDYVHLDTYSLALSKAGRPEDAAAVSRRVLALCARVHSECMIERRRAYGYLYYWQETRDRKR